METTVKGNAFVFGDNLDTDQIYPGQYLELAQTEQIRRHAMAGVDLGFVDQFQPGDVIVGGSNFGCGSSREHAAIALKAVGAGAIVAVSFARIFYRNAINLGLPLLVVPGITDQFSQGDRIEIDMKAGRIVNLTTAAVLTAQPLSDTVLNILNSGGIKPLVKQQLEKMSV